MIFMTQMKLFCLLFSIGAVFIGVSAFMICYDYYYIGIDKTPQEIKPIPLIPIKSKIMISDYSQYFSVIGFWMMLYGLYPAVSKKTYI